MSESLVMTQRLRGAAENIPAWWPVALWAGILFAGFLPLLASLGIERWNQPHYQFFPLMILAAVYVGWQRVQEIPSHQVTPGSKTLPGVLLTLSFLMFLAAAAWWSPYLAAVSSLIALIAVAWYLGGGGVLRVLVPAGALLALIIGPPVGIMESFLQSLREWAVWSSSVPLIWLCIPHLMTGTVIEIPGSRLLVAEACSGINSMMAVMGFTLVLAFIRRRSPAIIAALIAAGLVFVLWANMVRIAGGTWLKAVWDVDVLSGEIHMWASLVLFSVCMSLVFSMDELIVLAQRWREARQWRFRGGAAPIPTEAAPEPQLAITQPYSFQISRGMWCLAVIFALLGAAQIVTIATHGGAKRWVFRPAGVSSLRAGAAFTGSANVVGWERSASAERLLNQPEREGKQSQAWVYQQGGVNAVVAIDYPFPGYHDLTICYRNGGWDIEDEKEQRPAAGAFSVVRTGRLNEHGYLWFAATDEEGQWTEAPKAGVGARLVERFGKTGKASTSDTTYQIQVWAQTYTPLTEAQQGQLEQLFLAVRQDLAKQVLSQLQK